MRHVAVAAPVLVAALLVTGCATPPEREIGLAEAAIAQARATGADTIVPGDFATAVKVLDEARQAVRAGDYRLALSRALDAREWAETAMSQVGERRAALTAEVETTLVAFEAMRDEMDAKLTQARAAGSPVGLASIEASVATADQAVQEARSALANGEPAMARDRLAGAFEELRKAAAALGAVPSASG